MTTNNNPTTPVSFDALAVGRSSTSAFITVFNTRNPNSNDVNYPVQQRWYNTEAQTEYILTGYSIVGEVKTAVWQAINASQIAATETLTGNSGGPVGVDINNNINTIGDTTTINIVGNPGTNTLTASVSGAVITTINTGSGTATGSGNAVTIAGGTGIVTSASGSTVTVATAGDVAVLYTEDSGTAVPSAGNLIIAGASGITTSGAGHTVTVTAGVTIPTTFNEDAGSAVPASNALSIVGGANISTSGAGHTVTITNGIAFSTGSFTPTLQFSGSSTGITYAAQNGHYTVVGNMVFYQTSIVLTSKGSAVGSAQLAGLPFPAGGPNTLSGNPQLGTITFSGYANVFSTSGQSFLTFEQTTSGVGYTDLTNANFANNSSVSVGGFYFTS